MSGGDWVWTCTACHDFRDWGGSGRHPIHLEPEQKIWLFCKTCKQHTIHVQMNDEGQSAAEYFEKGRPYSV